MKQKSASNLVASQQIIKEIKSASLAFGRKTTTPNKLVGSRSSHTRTSSQLSQHKNFASVIERDGIEGKFSSMMK